MIARHRWTHRKVWALLALLLPAILCTALLLRQDPRAGAAAVQLEPGKGLIR